MRMASESGHAVFRKGDICCLNDGTGRGMVLSTSPGRVRIFWLEDAKIKWARPKELRFLNPCTHELPIKKTSTWVPLVGRKCILCDSVQYGVDVDGEEIKASTAEKTLIGDCAVQVGS